MVRKLIFICCALALLTTAWTPPTHAKRDREKPGKKVVDADRDGYNIKRDCNDSDNSVYPGAPESCGDVDSNCDGNVEPCEPQCTDKASG